MKSRVTNEILDEDATWRALKNVQLSFLGCDVQSVRARLFIRGHCALCLALCGYLSGTVAPGVAARLTSPVPDQTLRLYIGISCSVVLLVRPHQQYKSIKIGIAQL